MDRLFKIFDSILTKDGVIWEHIIINNGYRRTNRETLSYKLKTIKDIFGYYPENELFEYFKYKNITVLGDFKPVILLEIHPQSFEYERKSKTLDKFYSNIISELTTQNEVNLYSKMIDQNTKLMIKLTRDLDNNIYQSFKLIDLHITTQIYLKEIVLPKPHPTQPQNPILQQWLESHV